MPDTDNPVTRRRIETLRNEYQGVCEYLDALERHCDAYPHDAWAASQLRGYRKRLDSLKQELAQFE